MRIDSIRRKLPGLAKGAWCFLAAITMMMAQMGTPPGGGTPPDGSPPGGSETVRYKATYVVDGSGENQANAAYLATATDTSAIWITNSGALILTSPDIKTRGNSSSNEGSSFYGLNAALLATSGGTVKVEGGSITTSGSGANGAFAMGNGSSVILEDLRIEASGEGSHAAMATQNGAITLKNVALKTTGGRASAIATDRGGGTIDVAGGTVTVEGPNSAGFYSTGIITARGTTVRSMGAEMAVIEGANSITLTDVNMSSAMEKWGVLVYQSFSGDAEGNRGTFTMTGGSLAYMPTAGPLFYVTNTTGVIKLTGVELTARSGIWLKVGAGGWGHPGSNGGHAIVTADEQSIIGNAIIDSLSELALTMKNGSSLTGAIDTGKSAKRADLTLDATCKWVVTADSHISALRDESGVVDDSISNIAGNGHNVYYDASLPDNAYLDGKTYSLLQGGALLPAGGLPAGAQPAGSGAAK